MPVSNPTRATPLHIGAIVRDALVFDFKRHRQYPAKTDFYMDSLLKSVAGFFDELNANDVDYVLVGGIALLQYVEGRNTQDIDVIVALDDLRKIPYLKIELQDDDFARADYQGLRVDLLLTRNALFEKVHRHYAAPQQFLECTIPCATVEGLLLLKLYALPALYRLGNFARVGIYEQDIAILIQQFRPDLPALWKELEPHLGESDFQSVQQIVVEIEARIARFEQRAEG